MNAGNPVLSVAEKEKKNGTTSIFMNLHLIKEKKKRSDSLSRWGAAASWFTFREDGNPTSIKNHDHVRSQKKKGRILIITKGQRKKKEKIKLPKAMESTYLVCSGSDATGGIAFRSGSLGTGFWLSACLFFTYTCIYMYILAYCLAYYNAPMADEKTGREWK